MKTSPAPQARVATEEDRVIHAFQVRRKVDVIEAGDPSLCGLVKYTGHPIDGTKSIPPNACSLCLEALQL